jgi:hypothetical protein
MPLRGNLTTVPAAGFFEMRDENVKQRNVKQRNVNRLASVLAIAGPVIAITAGHFHGGTDPQNLVGVLLQYAANPYWKIVHLGQFLGLLLIVGALMLVLNDLRRASLATLGGLAAVVVASSYAANQVVDGIAIQFVSRAFVEAPAQERAMALSIAEAVRHIEQGLSGMVAINLGIALALLGGAIILSRACQAGSAGPPRLRAPPSWSSAFPSIFLDFRNTSLPSGPAYRCSSGCSLPLSCCGGEAVTTWLHSRDLGPHPGSQALTGDWLPIPGRAYKSAPRWGHVAEWLRSGLQNRNSSIPAV